MLIKTTHDNIENHFFMAYSEKDDTEQDYGVSKIFYKIWAINTSNKMLQPPNNKKSKMESHNEIY